MKTTTTDHRPLTIEELDALREYAARKGRTWKSCLRDAWMHTSLCGPIHALRNSHGPSWLAAFKLPAKTPAPAPKTVKPFRKVVRIGQVKIYRNATSYWSPDVYVKVEYADGRLSISGVIGPTANGNARGSSGQIDSDFAHRSATDNDSRCAEPITPDQIVFAPGWNAEQWLNLLDIWQRWHLNDMRAGCPHQRAEGWDRRVIDPAKPRTAYGKHFPGQKHDSWNLLAWVTPGEHSEGLLTKPCPTCGYRYGTAWLREEVPVEVLEALRALPDADRTPAWI